VLPGFLYNINGQGNDFNVSTASDGIAITSCIQTGEYNVTEFVPEGWEVTIHNL